MNLFYSKTSTAPVDTQPSDAPRPTETQPADTQTANVQHVDVLQYAELEASFEKLQTEFNNSWSVVFEKNMKLGFSNLKLALDQVLTNTRI